MKMNRKKGIRLTAESDRTSVWLLQGLLAALLSCTVLFTVFEGCGLHCTMALISAAAACIAWAVLRYFGKEQFFSPGLLLLLLITALAFGTAITDGACIAWNRSGYTYTAATARVLPLLSSSGTKESLAFNLFSAVLGAVTALIALPAVKKARALAAISLPLLLLLIRLLTLLRSFVKWLMISPVLRLSKYSRGRP